MENKPQKESLFNAGLAQLERIHNIKVTLHLCRASHDWTTFVDMLCSFRNELNPRMTKDQQEKAEEMEKKCLAQQQEYIWQKRILRAPLIEYERYLTTLEASFGMLMPDKPDASEAGEL